LVDLNIVEAVYDDKNIAESNLDHKGIKPQKDKWHKYKKLTARLQKDL
jgi:hypothetical protein